MKQKNAKSKGYKQIAKNQNQITFNLPSTCKRVSNYMH